MTHGLVSERDTHAGTVKFPDGYLSRRTATWSPPIDLPAICISSTEWGFLTQRQQHLMHRYSAHAPVLFVDPLQHASHLILLRLAKPQLHQVSPRLWSLSFVKDSLHDRTVPQLGFGSNLLTKQMPHLEFLSDLLTRQMVRSTARRLEIEKHLLWCYRYESAVFKHSTKTKFVVYDCVDDWSAFGTQHRYVRSREMRLLAISDVVFTTSSRLYEAKRRLNPHTYLVQNGVDFEHFNVTARNLGVPTSLERVAQPIIGFTGAVDNWIDLDLIKTIANRRPEWSFVFVGPISDRISMPRLPNMHFLGKVPYDVLPQHIAAFKVCLLPFRHTELTESVDPIKMYEYLAVGKPIVSTDLPEVRRFAHLIDIADGTTAFERAIALALEEDSPDLVRDRQAVAAANSWNRRFETMMRIIQERRDAIGV